MSDQIGVPCTFMRGGTSKGLFFRWEDVPDENDACHRLFAAALGSPDPSGRQLDGMGGGVSSLSKVMMVRRSTRPGIEIDYLFGQVAVDAPLVDLRSNCGNLSAAVGVFAVDQGLVRLPDGPATIAMFNENTGKRVDCHLELRGGRAAVLGDFEIDGVRGGGAPIRLEFLDPGGAVTGRLLPTGNPVDRITLGDGQAVDVSIVDATNPCVFVAAQSAGIDGTELPTALAERPDLVRWFEDVRTRAGVMVGIANSPREVPATAPKIAAVASPRRSQTLDGRVFEAADADLQVRMISMGKPHLAIPLTGALCAAVAARIDGTLVQQAARPKQAGELLRIVHGSGMLAVLGEVRRDGDDWLALSASVMRTARTLMQGTVFAPAPVLEAAE